MRIRQPLPFPLLPPQRPIKHLIQLLLPIHPRQKIKPKIPYPHLKQILLPMHERLGISAVNDTLAMFMCDFKFLSLLVFDR